MGWGACLHGGHGLWTQPWAAAFLIASLAFSCRAFAPKANACNAKRGFLARIGIQGFNRHRMVSAAWLGIAIGCCGLCNILYGYMAGVAVVAVSAVAIFEACRHFFATLWFGNPPLQPQLDGMCTTLGLLAIAGMSGFVCCAHFILPHLLAASSASNYEARDYKVRFGIPLM